MAGCEWPEQVWQSLHMEFLGPIRNKHHLVVSDAHSKWPEVFESASTSSQMIVEFIRQTFARFSSPETIVADNAFCFTSTNFQNFFKINYISHITSPPFHAGSNDTVENSVRTVKNGLKKSFSESTPLDTNRNLSRLLLDNRSIEHSTTE